MSDSSRHSLSNSTGRWTHAGCGGLFAYGTFDALGYVQRISLDGRKWVAWIGTKRGDMPCQKCGALFDGNGTRVTYEDINPLVLAATVARNKQPGALSGDELAKTQI